MFHIFIYTYIHNGVSQWFPNGSTGAFPKAFLEGFYRSAPQGQGARRATICVMMSVMIKS